MTIRSFLRTPLNFSGFLGSRNLNRSGDIISEFTGSLVSTMCGYMTIYENEVVQCSESFVRANKVHRLGLGYWFNYTHPTVSERGYLIVLKRIAIV